MKRLRRPALTLTLIAFAILACTLGAPAADPSATETVVAAAVMTQLSPTQSPISTLSTPPPDSGGKCGDGIWDDAEQADPGLCPQDRPTDAPAASPAVAQSTPPAGDDLHQAEQAFLPQVTAVEKWVEISVISQRQNFAPSIVKLHEGGYRIFWNDALAGGITSATSPDGLTFTADSGLRFA
ncbi:MAG: hypothetical protein AAB217_13495, partial [Chloroflexota bacterium]